MPRSTPGNAAGLTTAVLRAIQRRGAIRDILYWPGRVETAVKSATAKRYGTLYLRQRVRVDCLPPGLNKKLELSHACSERLLGYTALALAE